MSETKLAETVTLDGLLWCAKLAVENGYFAAIPLDGTRYAALAPFMFTTAILEGRIGDASGYSRRWCFHDDKAALDALVTWRAAGARPDTEPEGWHRSVHDGRRREEGDPNRETVAW